MRKAGWIALVLCIAGILATYWMTIHVFEGLPHVEDEMAYTWQAEVFARGRLTAPTPPDPEEMYVPFVVNHNGQRSAKYPPGWPMMLSFGVRLHARQWVNPLLAGAAIWLLYRLGSKILSRQIALLACALTLTSPFFLILGGSLHSSMFSLVLSLIFTLAWLDTFDLAVPSDTTPRRPAPRWMTVTVAGLSLALLALTRPLTAVGVALPFFIHGLVLLGRGPARVRVLAIGGITAVVAAAFVLWQYRVTGSPLIDPYTLWWPYDKIGFGKGIGIYPGGHSLKIAFHDARIMLSATAADLFGWKDYSWLFLPFGLWAIRRNRAGWLTASVFVSLVISYLLYWAQVTRYGPRYYFEGLPGLTLVSAAGIAWLVERAGAGWWRITRLSLLTALLVGLVTYNLAVYMPRRNMEVFGLYGVHRDKLAPFHSVNLTARTPALVFVKVGRSFTDYAELIELEDPWLTTPFIFASSINPERDAELARHYPDRQVIYYSPYRTPEFQFITGP